MRTVSILKGELTRGSVADQPRFPRVRLLHDHFASGNRRPLLAQGPPGRVASRPQTGHAPTRHVSRRDRASAPGSESEEPGEAPCRISHRRNCRLQGIDDGCERTRPSLLQSSVYGPTWSLREGEPPMRIREL